MRFVLDASTAIRIAVPQALDDVYAQGVMRLLERRGMTKLLLPVAALPESE